MEKLKKVIIAGGGPAGASLAIRLRRSGFEVTVIEKDVFPREKLCGEFISPECFRHFDELGVLEEMNSLGGDRITETVFFAKNGRSVAVPTDSFGSGGSALSLSRSAMDLVMLDRAHAEGAEVHQGSRVTACSIEKDRIVSVAVTSRDGSKQDLAADIFVDATGRPATLRNLARRSLSESNDRGRSNSKLVGLKAHLSGASVPKGICEIYVFDGGYCGLSNVENGFANICLLAKADASKSLIGKTNHVIEALQSQNRRAAETLAGAVPVEKWHAVSVAAIGDINETPFLNCFAVGDAGAFIDPFTGSGMLMALEGSEILSKMIKVGDSAWPSPSAYRRRLRQAFRRRLAVSGVLRRAAFLPWAASAMINLASGSDRILYALARGTRPSLSSLDTER